MLLKLRMSLLDGTIFFGNTAQKDRATFMNKNIPILSSTTPFNNKKPTCDIPPNKCC